MAFKMKLAGLVLALSLLIGSGGVFAVQSPEYDRITGEMTGLRELELLQPLDIEVQSRAELREWLAEELGAYPEEEQAIDERVAVVFGLIEPGTDLGDLEVEVLGEQIAGYYDAETKSMVVVADNSAEITASHELTFAHELVHALQDQHFDLVALQDDMDTATGDELLSRTALIEGDATFGEVLYLVEYPELFDALDAEAEEDEATALDSAPLYYSEILLFPYDQGGTFVMEIHDQGGWAAVDAMYQAPPISTEQILHPEKYLNGEVPVDVPVDDPSGTLGADWQMLERDVMGEFITGVFLRNGGAKNRDARDASEGWGGDENVVVGNDDETAFIWTSTWDTDDDADEFFNVLAATELRRLGAEVENIAGESHIRLVGAEYVGEIVLDGDTVTYTLAETVETLESMTD